MPGFPKTPASNDAPPFGGGGPRYKDNERLERLATRAKRAQLRRQAESYLRHRDLGALVRVPASWLVDTENPEIGAAIRRRLRHAIALERIRLERSPFGPADLPRRLTRLRCALLGEFALARQVRALRH